MTLTRRQEGPVTRPGERTLLELLSLIISPFLMVALVAQMHKEGAGEEGLWPGCAREAWTVQQLSWTVNLIGFQSTLLGVSGWAVKV